MVGADGFLRHSLKACAFLLPFSSVWGGKSTSEGGGDNLLGVTSLESDINTIIHGSTIIHGHRRPSDINTIIYGSTIIQGHRRPSGISTILHRSSGSSGINNFITPDKKRKPNALIQHHESRHHTSLLVPCFTGLIRRRKS
ncbi:unnamed protein product [Zymoseptoria tritici ST99CH_1E4]|uniref:Secreted protein n=1 Tax=Zymoseptoria tritici ST99CH_1E4 TaxID=1276532 RepID=A0A2H1HBT5_ZYMTR|nr:unnamed protein product [Zymoseptoria tritici ST99CH_1E4]